MKTINLLPKEEKITDIKSILLNTILIILIIILVVMGILSVVLFNVNDYLIVQLDNYTRVNMRISNDITKLEEYNNFKEKVKENEKLIDYLQEEEVIWSDVLYDFSQKMPRNTYVTYIEGDSKEYYNLIYESEKVDPDKVDKVLYFNIGGYALEYADVTKLIVHIGNMDNVGEVLINNISKNYVTDSNIEVLSFNISAYMDIEPFLEELRKKQKEEQVEEIEQETLEQELGV